MTPDWYVAVCMAFVGIMAVLTAVCCVLIWRQGYEQGSYFSPQTDAARRRLHDEAERSGL
jgi:formate-dependent nitrite reductase membrane component NrfD